MQVKYALCEMFRVFFFQFSICLGCLSSHFDRNNKQLLSSHLLSSTHDFIPLLSLVFSKLKNFSLFDFSRLLLISFFLYVLSATVCFWRWDQELNTSFRECIQDTRAVKIMVFMSLSGSFLIIPVIYLFCFVKVAESRRTEHC